MTVSIGFGIEISRDQSSDQAAQVTPIEPLTTFDETFSKGKDEIYLLEITKALFCIAQVRIH